PRQRELDHDNEPNRSGPCRAELACAREEESDDREQRALPRHVEQRCKPRLRERTERDDRGHLRSFFVEGAFSASAILRSISRSSSRVRLSSSTRRSTSESAWPSNTSRTKSRKRSRSTLSRR